MISLPTTQWMDAVVTAMDNADVTAAKSLVTSPIVWEQSKRPFTLLHSYALPMVEVDRPWNEVDKQRDKILVHCIKNGYNPLTDPLMGNDFLGQELGCLMRLRNICARFDLRDHNGNTLLHIACNGVPWAKAIKRLALPAHANAPNTEGQTPLHLLWDSVGCITVAEDFLHATTVLLSKGADLNARDNANVSVWECMQQTRDHIHQRNFSPTYYEGDIDLFKQSMEQWESVVQKQILQANLTGSPPPTKARRM